MTEAPPNRQGDHILWSIQPSPAFQQAWQELSVPRQRSVDRTIARLSSNPAHPSLKVHRVKRMPHADIWICYVSETLRLLYQRQAHTIHLLDVGTHRIIDRVHLRCFPDATAESDQANERQRDSSQARGSRSTTRRGRAHKRNGEKR